MPDVPPDHLLPEHTTGRISSEEREGDGGLALRMLYEEQTRLRAQVEELRKKQEKSDSKGEKKEDSDGDDKQGDDGKKEGDDKGKKDGDEEGNDDKEKENKPPLKARVRVWVREHPGYTILIAVGVVLLIIGTILLVHYLDSYVDTDDAFIDGHTDPISARINGIVAKVYVEDTYRVRKGQLLVELDARDNQVAKEQANANYAQAQASTRAQAPNVPITATDQSTRVVNEDFNVVSARANVAAAEERHRSALADLRQSEATEANAAREEERYRQLVVKEEVSREQYDQRVTQERIDAAVVASRRETSEAAAKSVTQAEAQLGQAEQQARQARQDLPQQIAMQKEQLAQRRASELAAKAQMDQSELNLEYTKIYAPEDGVIGDKQVQVATQVAPGQELFALTQTNDIWITANFKETEIARMHPGQSVTVYVDALSTKFEGYVEALPGASGAVFSLLPPENATGNYVKVVQRLPVRIRLNPNQPGENRLSPGMSVVPKVWLR
jgi:membrane fusion protein (multidrug efflux system)